MVWEYQPLPLPPPEIILKILRFWKALYNYIERSDIFLSKNLSLDTEVQHKFRFELHNFFGISGASLLGLI